MKTRHIVTAVVAAIGGIYTISRFGTSLFGVMSGLNVAVIIGIAGMVVDKALNAKDDMSKGFVVKDERTILIESKSSRVAFIVGNYIWLALLWYEFAADRWIPWPRIGSPPVILVGLMATLIIYFASTVYYRNRK